MLTFVFAGLFGIIFAILSINVIRLRVRDQTPIGAENNPLLAKSVRAHGNLAEYIPFALLLSFFCEAGGVSHNMVFYCLSALLFGRLLHIYSVFAKGSRKKILGCRAVGISLTIFVIIVFSVLLLSGGNI